MKRLQPSYANFTQATFEGLSTAKTDTGISDAFTPATLAAYLTGDRFPPQIKILVKLQGAPDAATTEVQVSLGITDANGCESFSAPTIGEVRTLSDGSQVVSLLTLDTLQAVSLRISLETAIGGAGAKVYYCFQDEG